MSDFTTQPPSFAQNIIQTAQGMEFDIKTGNRHKVHVIIQPDFYDFWNNFDQNSDADTNVEIDTDMYNNAAFDLQGKLLSFATRGLMINILTRYKIGYFPDYINSGY